MQHTLAPGDRGHGAVLDSESQSLVALAGGQQPLYAVLAPTAAPRRAPFSINGRDRLNPTGGECQSLLFYLFNSGNYGAFRCHHRLRTMNIPFHAH
jgi:hypothetical protein